MNDAEVHAHLRLLNTQLQQMAREIALIEGKKESNDRAFLDAISHLRASFDKLADHVQKLEYRMASQDIRLTKEMKEELDKVWVELRKEVQLLHSRITKTREAMGAEHIAKSDLHIRSRGQTIAFWTAVIVAVLTTVGSVITAYLAR